MSNEIKGAVEHLKVYGYCLLEDRIPEDLAHSLGAALPRVARRFQVEPGGRSDAALPGAGQEKEDADRYAGVQEELRTFGFTF